MKSINRSRLKNRSSLFRHVPRGVTLIELMVVIVIIGLLAGLIAPNVVDYIDKARVATAKAQIKHLHDAVRNYYMDTGEYPQTLLDLVEEPPGVEGWNKNGYLDNATEIPQDPWNNDFEYQYPGTLGGNFDIFSYGRDGQEGGADEDADIYNTDLGRRSTDVGGAGH